MIYLKWAGRMANRLIEYLFALAIHSETDCGIKCNMDHIMDKANTGAIPGFPNVKDREPVDEHEPQFPTFFIGGQKPIMSEKTEDQEEVVRSIISYEDLFDLARKHDIEMQGFFQRMDFLSKYKDLAREVCYSDCSIHPLIEAKVDYQNDLVIHLRYGDYHHNHQADKISWTHKPLEIDEVLAIFRKIQNQVVVKQTWIVCEHADDMFVRKIATSIRNSYIVSVSPTHDFALIGKFKHVFASPSTFSFMAAWTSNVTQKVFFPLVGAFHPKSHTLPNADPPECRWHFFIDDDRFTYIDITNRELPFLKYRQLGVDDIL